jgi:sulfate transport system permease protein
MRDIAPRSPLAILCVVIVLVYAAILLIAPITAILASAFKDSITPVIRALTEPDALAALRLSVLLAALAAIINTAAGIIIAWVLVRLPFPGKRLLDALIDLPFVVSPVIVGYVLIVLFGRNGWIPAPIAYSWSGMLIVTVFVSLPFVVREVMPALEALTPEQEEAAYTLGAYGWTTFWRIVFPALRASVLYGLVLTLARALGEFGAVAVAGGGIQGVTETATIYVFRSLNDRNDVGAYSIAIVLGLTAIVVLIIMNRLKRTIENEGTARDVHRPG